jgi:hypothetical protein
MGEFETPCRNITVPGPLTAEGNKFEVYSSYKNITGLKTGFLNTNLSLPLKVDNGNKIIFVEL